MSVDGAEMSYAPGQYGASPSAQCPAGMIVIGTGFNGPFNDVGGFVTAYGTFVGGFFANDSSVTVKGNVQALCAAGATTSQASTFSASRPDAAKLAYERDVAAAAAREKAN